MVSDLEQLQKSLYDTDYNLWIEETVKKLQAKNFDNLDLENLIEEVSDLSRREKRKLKNLLIKLFEHILKLTCWRATPRRLQAQGNARDEAEREYNRGHWEREILNFRQQINDELEDSPSLKPYLLDIFSECYQKGRALASKRSQLPLNTFPSSPIGNVEQILDENWIP